MGLSRSLTGESISSNCLRWVWLYNHDNCTWTMWSQGEYIAPEKVENIYVQSKFVAQSYLYGDSLKSCCVAIVIPDEEVLVPWARENGKQGSFKDLCASEVRGVACWRVCLLVMGVAIGDERDDSEGYGGCRQSSRTLLL